jgi:hypothetical protein
MAQSEAERLAELKQKQAEEEHLDKEQRQVSWKNVKSATVQRTMRRSRLWSRL